MNNWTPGKASYFPSDGTCSVLGGVNMMCPRTRHPSCKTPLEQDTPRARHPILLTMLKPVLNQSYTELVTDHFNCLGYYCFRPPQINSSNDFSLLVRLQHIFPIIGTVNKRLSFSFKFLYSRFTNSYVTKYCIQKLPLQTIFK